MIFNWITKYLQLLKNFFARDGERTLDLLVNFIYLFSHFTAKLQWLPICW